MKACGAPTGAPNAPNCHMGFENDDHMGRQAPANVLDMQPHDDSGMNHLSVTIIVKKLPRNWQP